MPKNKGAPGTRSTRANARDSSPSHSDLEPSQELPSKKRWTGKQKGAQKFTEADESRLFDILEEILPIGHDMWGKVEERYNEPKALGTCKTRDSKYLKGHYTSLMKTKKSTGDPNRPPNMKRALHHNHYLHPQPRSLTGLPSPSPSQ